MVTESCRIAHILIRCRLSPQVRTIVSPSRGRRFTATAPFSVNHNTYHLSFSAVYDRSAIASWLSLYCAIRNI